MNEIKLFEETHGIKTIISTSSIIEGVNTSAENIVIWKNKNGSRNLNDFTYNNIIGRGGRMFKHFVGQIYILEKPPVSEDTELDINIPEEIYVDIDEHNFEQDLTKEQVAKIIEKKSELQELLQVDNYDKFVEENNLFAEDRDIELNLVNDSFNDNVINTELNVDNNSNDDVIETVENEYIIYHIHIVQESDTLDSIIKKYDITLDYLKEYNDISEIKVGTKLIIPDIINE